MAEPRYISPSKAVMTWDIIPGKEPHFLLLSKWKPKSVSVEGNFQGCRVIIEGNANPDSSKMFILNDPYGNPLVFESERLEGILEDCVKIRPRLSGGSSSTAVTVNMLLLTMK